MSSPPSEAAAMALLRSGRLAEAESAWRAILAVRPADAVALHFLGCTLAQAGRSHEGLELIDRSLAAAPDNPVFLDNRARLRARDGRLDEAVIDLRRAVRADSGFFAGYFRLGVLLRKLGRTEEAIGALRHAVRLEPRNPDALLNLGHALRVMGRLDEAIEHYSLAVGERPEFPEALLDWGNALVDGGFLEAGRDLYDRALAHAPRFTQALMNRAGVSLDLGELNAARSYYRRALEIQPGLPNALYGLGQIALREGRFDEGWRHYECRFDTDPPQAARRALALPRLTLDNMASARRVAVWAEQGVGDQILYSTLLPELVERGVRAVVEVDPRLLAAYRRSLPALDFTTGADAESAFAACDFQIPIGSLPLLFRSEGRSFARQPLRLLRADAARVSEMRERLGGRKHIAISWRSLQGGSHRAFGERKSIPLEHFRSLAGTGDATLLDLQYGDVQEERAAFAAAHPGILAAIEGLDRFNDLEGVLAAIAACERVVTASNVIAHLAGALGKDTTLVFLRGWPPFHYWAAGADGRSLWYPAVRVPGKPEWKDWDAAFAALATLDE